MPAKYLRCGCLDGVKEGKRIAEGRCEMELTNNELERLLNVATVCIRRIYRDGGRIEMDTAGEVHEPVLQEGSVPLLIISAGWLNAATGEEIIQALAKAEWDLRRKRKGRQ